MMEWWFIDPVFARSKLKPNKKLCKYYMPKTAPQLQYGLLSLSRTARTFEARRIVPDKIVCMSIQKIA